MMRPTRPYARKSRSKKKSNKKVAFKSTAAVKADVKTLKKQVSKISKSLKTEMAKHTYKSIEGAQVAIASANNAVYAGVSGSNASILETAMASLRYYDPSIPGTLVTANFSTGTFSRNIRVRSAYNSIEVKNNYQVPVDCIIYAVVPKFDTDIAAVTMFTSGLTDQGNPTATFPDLYLTDSDLFNEGWRIVKTVRKHLLPGHQAFCNHSSKSFTYNPAETDTHALAFQNQWGAVQFVIRLVGSISHDSVTPFTAVGLTFGAVDYVMRSKFVFEYDAGVNLNDYSILNNLTMTNTGIVSQPVQDNQLYAYN